jgi:hypothetical protein
MAQFYGAGTVATNCTALKGCPMKLHDPIDFRVQKNLVSFADLINRENCSGAHQ